MHTMGKSDLTPEEHDTTRKSKESCTIITASGSITTTEEATVYVRDVVMCITVHILEDSPAVLSLGKFLRTK